MNPVFDVALIVSLSLLGATLFLVALRLPDDIQIPVFLVTAQGLKFLGQRGVHPFGLEELVIAGGIWVLAIRALYRHQGAQFSAVAVGAFAAFVGWAVLLAFVNSLSVPEGLMSVILHFKYLPLLLITPVLVRTSRGALLILGVAVASSWLVSVLGFLELVRYQALGSLVASLGSSSSTRLLSLFPNPNMLGVFGGFVLVMLTGYWAGTQGQHWRMRFAFLLVLIPIAGMVLATSSRRSWLAVILALPLLSWLLSRATGRRSPVLYIALPIGITLALVSVLFQTDAIITRFLSTFSGEDASILDRVFTGERLWMALLSDGNATLGGMGAGLLGRGVDNYYLLLWVEYGALGLVLYLWLLGSPLLRSIRRIRWLKRFPRKSTQASVLAVSAVAASVAILLAGIGGNTNITFPVNMYLPTIVGVAVAMSSNRVAAGHGQVTL